VEENFKQSISGILDDVRKVSSTFGVDLATAAQLIVIYELVCIHEHAEPQPKKSLFFRT
jgi:hypothetical protein